MFRLRRRRRPEAFLVSWGPQMKFLGAKIIKYKNLQITKMSKMGRNGSRIDDMTNGDRESTRTGPNSIFRPVKLGKMDQNSSKYPQMGCFTYMALHENAQEQQQYLYLTATGLLLRGVTIYSRCLLVCASCTGG